MFECPAQYAKHIVVVIRAVGRVLRLHVDLDTIIRLQESIRQGHGEPHQDLRAEEGAGHESTVGNGPGLEHLRP